MVDFRMARQSDEADLRQLDAGTWSLEVTPSPMVDCSFFNERTVPSDVLVAVSDELVVGYVKLRQTIPLPSHEHVLEIAGLAVAPTHQRQGLGARLLQLVAQEAVTRGARKLTLRVLGPNLRARALYGGAGFVVEGVLKEEFLLGGDLVDDVVMARYLGV